MLQRKSTIALAAAGVTGAIAITAVVVAASSGGTSYGKPTSGAPPATSTGVRTFATTVDGKPTTILTDTHGSPLYYYAADTATKSNVTGGLAGLWPPVTDTSIPTTPGLAARSRSFVTRTAANSPTTGTCSTPSSATIATRSPAKASRTSTSRPQICRRPPVRSPARVTP